MARILLIDDDHDVRTLLVYELEAAGHDVRVARDGMQGLVMQRAAPAELVITDIFMPEKDGIETIQELRREFPGVQIIAMTGRESLTDFDAFEVARELGAVKTFKKPFKLDDLVAAVNELTSGN